MEDAADWAYQIFGSARPGDTRRVDRLVFMAEQVARQPAGKGTEVFSSSADREGALRFLQSAQVSADSVSEPVVESTARSCCDQSVAYVAVDKALTFPLGSASSLTITDRAKRRELGRKHYRRTFGDAYPKRETRYWLETIEDARSRLATHGENQALVPARQWCRQLGDLACGCAATVVDNGALCT